MLPESKICKPSFAGKKLLVAHAQYAGGSLVVNPGFFLHWGYEKCKNEISNMFCVCVCVVQCELYHWVDVLDRFDKILSEACQDGQLSPTNSDPTHCVFMCPRLQDEQVGQLHPSLFISSPPLLPPLSLSLSFSSSREKLWLFSTSLLCWWSTRTPATSTILLR